MEEVIPYKNENRNFMPLHPSDGSYRTFLIDEELIAYTTLLPASDDPDDIQRVIQSSRSETPLLRGFKQTTIVKHEVDTEIIYVDHVIDLEESAYEPPINQLNYRDDSTQLYNQVEIKYNNRTGTELIYRIEDTESIKIYGERETSFEVPLDRHQLLG